MMTQLGTSKSIKIIKGNTEISKIFYREKQVWANAVGPVGPGGKINEEFWNSYVKDGKGFLALYTGNNRAQITPIPRIPYRDLVITQMSDRARVTLFLNYNWSSSETWYVRYFQVGLNTFITYATSELQQWVADNEYIKIKVKMDISINRPSSAGSVLYVHYDSSGNVDATPGKVWPIDTTVNISDIITPNNPNINVERRSNSFNQAYSVIPEDINEHWYNQDNTLTIDIYEFTFLK